MFVLVDTDRDQNRRRATVSKKEEPLVTHEPINGATIPPPVHAHHEREQWKG